MAFRKSRRLRRNTKKSRKNFRGGGVGKRREYGTSESGRSYTSAKKYDDPETNKKNTIAWYTFCFEMAVRKEENMLDDRKFLKTENEIDSVHDVLFDINEHGRRNNVLPEILDRIIIFLDKHNMLDKYKETIMDQFSRTDVERIIDKKTKLLKDIDSYNPIHVELPLVRAELHYLVDIEATEPIEGEELNELRTKISELKKQISKNVRPLHIYSDQKEHQLYTQIKKYESLL